MEVLPIVSDDLMDYFYIAATTSRMESFSGLNWVRTLLYTAIG